MNVEEFRISTNPCPPGVEPDADNEPGCSRRGRPFELPNAGEPEQDDGAPASAPPPTRS